MTIERGTALVALVAALAALFWTFFPNLKPALVTTRKADLHALTVERGVTRDEWRWRSAAGNTDRHKELVAADASDLDAPTAEACSVLGIEAGHVASVRTTATGFKRKDLTVRASLYAHPSGQRVEATEDEKYRSLARVPVDAPTDSSVQEIWIYDPGDAKRYRIRIGLYDQEDNLLAVTDSRPFLALAPDELRRLAQAKPQGC